MYRVGIISQNPKFGSQEDQRLVVGELDKEHPDTVIDDVFQKKGVRPGDSLHIAHALVLGKFRAREERLAILADMEVPIAVGGRDPMIYETPEEVAEFHAMSREKTGRGTKKQKRNKGRPQTYNRPNDEQMAKLRVWWLGDQHTDDVEILAGEMLGKKVPRATLAEWLGPRGRNPNRRRKKRSDAKK
jgi:hypothetical protein